MANIVETKGYCFDDVLLLPQYSEVVSRKDVDISTRLDLLNLKIPIISANMATVTDAYMAAKMSQLGGLGILHRFDKDEYIKGQIQFLTGVGHLCVPSIGVKPEDLDRAKIYQDMGVKTICIDIAHGALKSCVKMTENVSKLGLSVISGNVATESGAAWLAYAGAKVIKIGVGPGSVCSTRVVTGHGVPQLTAIMEIAEAFYKSTLRDVTFIADGGIRNSGDIVKALAAGAHAVMIGGLFAGTEETPGEVVNGKKVYRGMASKNQQVISKGEVSGVAEGEEVSVDYKGSVESVVSDLVAGVKSGLSYSGAFNLSELRVKAQFMIVSQNSLRESVPHALLK